MILSPGPVLCAPLGDLRADLKPAGPSQTPVPHRTLVEAEREHILEVLRQVDWVVGGRRGAAVRLGLPRTTLMHRMRRLGIVAEESRLNLPSMKPCILNSVLVCLTAALFTTTSCSNQSSGATASAPLVVEVAEVEQRDVPIYSEWIGTLDGFVNADIKAQVTGYLMEQAYQEGTFVKKGQLLFQIDPRPFQAALDQAQGQLAQSEGQLAQARAQLAQAEAQVAVAEANQRRTQLDVDRYTPLAQQQAITQQDLDNATQNNLAAKAQVQSAQAQVATARAQIIAANAAVQSAKATAETAQINLGFTRLTSPIDGIPGIAQQQVGSLVSPASPTITTVSTVDPIRVYFTVAEQEYLDFHRRYSTPPPLDAERKGLKLELILADGTSLSAKRDFLLRGSPGGRQDRRYPGGGTFSESRETPCVPASTGRFARRSECSRAPFWFLSAP